MKEVAYAEFPVGRLCVATRGDAITDVHFGAPEELRGAWRACENELHRAAFAQLRAYFAGARTEFSLPLAPEGTEFQQTVWQLLRAIPYGQTRAYGQIAQQCGRPKAARAVGGACHSNPILLLIPCHRVLGANGALTGFGCGIPMKKMLLALERAHTQA